MSGGSSGCDGGDGGWGPASVSITGGLLPITADLGLGASLVGSMVSQSLVGPTGVGMVLCCCWGTSTGGGLFQV